METYNGHESHAHWNVSLWIGNDEGLYNFALFALKNAETTEEAAAHMMLSLGNNETPDGTPYTYPTVLAAITGLAD